MPFGAPSTPSFVIDMPNKGRNETSLLLAFDPGLDKCVNRRRRAVQSFSRSEGGYTSSRLPQHEEQARGSVRGLDPPPTLLDRSQAIEVIIG
jgi:hypothetical protein